MIYSQALDIVNRLLANAKLVRYGSVSVSAKLHDGRVVEISFSTSEITREPKSKINNENEQKN